jgi:ubiquinone/menaquinone biosynthesis C-methylase UbiE
MSNDIDDKYTYLLSLLACPMCKGGLKSIDVNRVKCSSCEAAYPVEDGIPIMLPPQLDKFKSMEAEFHSNEAAEFAERHMKHSYRVARYHDDYLKCFSDCQKGAVVLEVGGGGGLEAVQLKNMGLTLIESDISVGMVKMGRRSAIAAGQDSASFFIVCDAEQLPCPDQSLDAILIVAALHHLPSPERFFAAAKRALKPGGQLVIGFEPNQWPYFTVYPALRLLRKILHPRRNASGGVSIGDRTSTGFTKTDFERFLQAEGLKKVCLQRIWYIDGFTQLVIEQINRKRPVGQLIDIPDPLQRALVAFDDFLSRVPLLRRFCWHWTLVAQRPDANSGLRTMARRLKGEQNTAPSPFVSSSLSLASTENDERKPQHRSDDETSHP